MTTTLETPTCLRDNVYLQHAQALAHSVEQSEMGYIADVEICLEVVLPKVIGIEMMAAMGIARSLLKRQLVPHTTDPSLMVITGIKNRIY